MAEYSREDHSLAQSLVEALFAMEGPVAEPKTRDEIDVLPRGLSIIDVQQDVVDFRGQIVLLQKIDQECPALVINRELTIPVSLLSGFGSPWHWLPFGWWPRRIPILYDIGSLVFLTLENARTYFFRGATDFLAHRIATIRQVSTNGARDAPGIVRSITLPPAGGAPPRATLGCKFTATSNTSGLRVLWSPAYFISANFFGAPTSPTTGVLQSGTYLFGVDGGPYGSTVRWDLTALCSLPGQPSVHINY